MKIDIWADIVCPFCYLGKRHLELALAEFGHADDVELVWHSFQLDPHLPARAPGPLAPMIAEKFGISVAESERNQRAVAAQASEVGLEFNWREARYANTFDAHRLVHLAGAHGRASEAMTRLMRAYFADGVEIGDPEALEAVGVELTLPRDELRAMLAGDDYGEAVRADEDEARTRGITGVPFFVFDDSLALAGAQPVATMRAALERAWADRGV